jgi:hypothetical protein
MFARTEQGFPGDKHPQNNYFFGMFFLIEYPLNTMRGSAPVDESPCSHGTCGLQQQPWPVLPVYMDKDGQDTTTVEWAVEGKLLDTIHILPGPSQHPMVRAGVSFCGLNVVM